MGVVVKNRHSLAGAWRFIVSQLSVTLGMAAIFLYFMGIDASISALLGGLLSAIPTAYFAMKCFKYHGARAAKQIVNNFYKGEAVKIALSLILFMLVFKFFHPIPLVFFSAYIAVQMVFWLTPLIFINKL